MLREEIDLLHYLKQVCTPDYTFLMSAITDQYVSAFTSLYNLGYFEDAAQNSFRFTSLGLAVKMKLVTDCASSLPFVSTISPRRAATTPLRVHCFTPRAVSSFCRTICTSTSRAQTQRKRRKNPPISKTSRFRTVAPGERKPSHSPI